jgi:hypothetical protein
LIEIYTSPLKIKIMNKNSNVTKNQYNVPSQKWNEFTPDSQSYFNDLYQELQSKRQTYISQIQQGQAGVNSQITQQFEPLLLDIAITATDLYTQRQLQSHDE